MITIGILGDIGSGKSFVAKSFASPVFNADEKVKTIYKENKNCFRELKKRLPKYIKSFPIDKLELFNAIVDNKKNLKKISDVVHPIVRKEMNLFLTKNKKKRIVVLDIPLLIENKLNKKKDILIFVNAKKKEINKRLQKRKNFNKKVLKIMKDLQIKPSFKKRISNFIINNNYNPKTLKNDVNSIKEEILSNE